MVPIQSDTLLGDHALLEGDILCLEDGDLIRNAFRYQFKAGSFSKSILG